MLLSHPMFKKIQSSDSTFLDLKDWFNPCTSALNADKQSKVGLRVSRPIDEDFMSTVKIVASPVRGRKPVCDASHLTLLLSECPAVMNTVEWTTKALLRCTGTLSPEKTCRFRLFSHPDVNGDSELLVEGTSVLKMPNRWMHQDVSSMKANQRKEYMRLILEESVKPIDAMSASKK